MDEKLDDAAFRFFKLFAQLEYAMKAIGYVEAGRHDQATPDWTRFVNERGTAVMEMQSGPVVAARDYLLAHPPKRQVFNGGVLEWAAVPPDDISPQALFGHVRRIRNNLYHGGKFNGRWLEPDRSELLLNHGLAVLEAVRETNHDVQEAIAGNDVL